MSLLAQSDTLLSREQISHTLQLLFNRMELVDAACPNKFPIYSANTTSRWLASSGGSWMGGFWSGCWWLRAQLTESSADRRKAALLCQSLSDKLETDSLNRTMIFWYGAALGARWFGDNDALQQTQKAIDALISSYDEQMQCIPLGTAMGGGKDGARCLSIDTFSSLVQLLSFETSQHNEAIAQQHTNTLLNACFTQEGAFHSHARYNLEQQHFQPTDVAGQWSRGQAWGMLGLSQAAQRWGEPYLSQARMACEYWQNTRADDDLPPNQLAQANGACDPSAAIVAALAMLTLSDQCSNGLQWRKMAHRQISKVIHSRYFIQLEGEHENSGLFWGCYYRTRPDTEEWVESPWGHFLLMTALAELNHPATSIERDA